MGAINLSQYLWPDVSQGRQPQIPLSLDSSNPMAGSVVQAWYPALGNNAITREPALAFSSIQLGAGSAKFSSASQIWFNDGGTSSTPTAYATQTGTFLAEVVIDSTAAGFLFCNNSRYNIGIGVESIPANQLGVSVYDGGFKVASTVDFPIGVPFLLGVTHTQNMVYLSINGVEKASVSHSAIQYTYNRGVTIGKSWAAVNSLTMRLGGFSYHSEYFSAVTNPWQIFAPQPIPLFSSAGGSALDVSASGYDTASGSASLSAQVALAAIGVSTAGGLANGGVNIPLSAAGISVAGGSANGTATVTISAAGLAQAAGAAGLSAAVLRQAAGAAQAAGNATLAVQLAALAAGAAQAGGSANLTGGAPGSIAASGGDTASGSAVLSVTVQLQATGSDTASGSANLTGGAPGAVSASGGAQAGGSATVKVAVNLTAAGFVRTMGAGFMAVQAPLSAIGAARAAGSAHATMLNGSLMTIDPRFVIRTTRRNFHVASAGRDFRLATRR